MQEEESPFAAFVGIDWADRKHDICLQVPGLDTTELSILEHRPKPFRSGHSSFGSASRASRSPCVWSSRKARSYRHCSSTTSS